MKNHHEDENEYTSILIRLKNDKKALKVNVLILQWLEKRK